MLAVEHAGVPQTSSHSFKSVAEIAGTVPEDTRNSSQTSTGTDAVDRQVIPHRNNKHSVAPLCFQTQDLHKRDDSNDPVSSDRTTDPSGLSGSRLPYLLSLAPPLVPLLCPRFSLAVSDQRFNSTIRPSRRILNCAIGRSIQRQSLRRSYRTLPNCNPSGPPCRPSQPPLATLHCARLHRRLAALRTIVLDPVTLEACLSTASA